MSEFSNLSSLKLLRSVDLLSKLTILQLSHIADSLSEVFFSDGQIIIDKVIHPFSLRMQIYVIFFFLFLHFFNWYFRMRIFRDCMLSRRDK